MAATRVTPPPFFGTAVMVAVLANHVMVADLEPRGFARVGNVLRIHAADRKG